MLHCCIKNKQTLFTYLFLPLRRSSPSEVTCFFTAWSAGLSGGDFISSLSVKSDLGITCTFLCTAFLLFGLTSSMGISSGLGPGWLGPLASTRFGCSTHWFWFWCRWLCIFFLCFLEGLMKEQLRIWTEDSGNFSWEFLLEIFLLNFHYFIHHMTVSCSLSKHCSTLSSQWGNARYIYSSTVLRYYFEVLVIYLSISIFCFFILKEEKILYFVDYSATFINEFSLSATS